MAMLNKNKVFLSLVFKFLERIGVQLVQFVIQIVLARILVPSEFGIISLLIVFINIANVFVQSGLVFAVMQKKEPHHIDYTTIFYISFFISIILYLLLFILAPVISGFLSVPTLIPLIRTTSIIIIIGSLLSVQNAYVIKNGKMKILMISSLFSAFLSGVISVSLAMFNFGVWSLVFQMILYNLINCLIYLFVLDWKPTLNFSIERAKTLFSFGWKILVSNFLNALYQDLRTFYI
ncbi:MAG: oligosaccharide flippase family protein, partial [Acholeplasma sp.]|nr:oligosaccharide flippase family protein [Acholeplasma sp.]